MSWPDAGPKCHVWYRTCTKSEGLLCLIRVELYQVCSKQACFGDAGSTKAEFCATHRPANYIDLTSK
eukprot:2478576-Rhodomonas_salina.3